MSETSETPQAPDAAQSGTNIYKIVGRHILQWFNVLRFDARSWGRIAGVALLLWLAAGIYNVQPYEQGVVLRFGKWIETTQPGLHYHLPYPIDRVLLPKVTQISQIQLGVSAAAGSDPQAPITPHDKQMLTGDENILEADCTVFWQIKDARQFLFNIADSEAAVRITAESALREVISRTPIQAVMSDKRRQIADQTRQLLQDLLDHEDAGVRITEVQLQRVDPPAEVIDAFNDVQRARADQERARNEAEAYSNDILPRARGEAEHIRHDADAYKSQVIALAQGEAASFAILEQTYAQAREVTAWRLYMDSVDELLKKAEKVIVDSSGKNVSQVVPFLPITDSKPVPPPAAPAGKLPQNGVTH